MQSKSILCVAFLGLIVSLALGSDKSNSERDSLKGIKEMDVVVEHFSDDQKKLGFNTDSFKTQVELRLRHSTIKITENADPFLYININVHLIEGQRVLPIEGQRVLLNIEVRFEQPARIIANDKIMLVTTWNKGMVGIGNLQWTKEIVDELVDKFINDYLAANQK